MTKKKKRNSEYDDTQDHLAPENENDELNDLTWLLSGQDNAIHVQLPPGSDRILDSAGSAAQKRHSNDPMNLYLREMGEADLLSIEKERELAQKIEMGRTASSRPYSIFPWAWQRSTSWQSNCTPGGYILPSSLPLFLRALILRRCTGFSPTHETGQ